MNFSLIFPWLLVTSGLLVAEFAGEAEASDLPRAAVFSIRFVGTVAAYYGLSLAYGRCN